MTTCAPVPQVANLPEIQKVWGAYATSGGDYKVVRGRALGYFLTKQEAEVAAQGYGTYGSPGEVVSHHVLVVEQKHYVLLDPAPIQISSLTPEDIRARATAELLKKLTPAERELLAFEYSKGPR